MKKYTDKELAALTPEALETLREKALQEFTSAGEELAAVLEKRLIAETYFQ